MSIKHSLMALLAQEPMYGAQLRSEFESRTGGTWPLNVGQVYTTLARLERDGLVEAAGAPDPEGRIAYRLTDSGAATVTRWWTSPVDRESTPRDELVIKLALAVTVGNVDVPAVVQTQRTATLRHLQDLTRLKRTAEPDDRSADSGRPAGSDLAWSLVLENLRYAAEAEVRWLDHVEARLAREALYEREERAAQGPLRGRETRTPETAPQGRTAQDSRVSGGERSGIPAGSESSLTNGAKHEATR